MTGLLSRGDLGLPTHAILLGRSKVLEVSRGGYYAWRRRRPSARAVVDTQLQVRIAASHRRSRGTYGSPRILRDLREDGIPIGRKRIARLLRAAGLRGVTRRRLRRLKRELIERQPWPSAPALDRALAEYIDGWYNPFRRHSRLGYLSPVAFEHTRREAA